MDEKQKKHEYYLKHKDAYLARQKARYEIHKEDMKQYYLAHQDELRKKTLAYYYSHKQERFAYQRKYRQQHAILYDNRPSIYGVNKAPRPAGDICPCCNKKGRLNWHHWNDENPNDGLWLCARCHRTLHYTLNHGIVKK